MPDTCDQVLQRTIRVAERTGYRVHSASLEKDPTLTAKAARNGWIVVNDELSRLGKARQIVAVLQQDPRSDFSQLSQEELVLLGLTSS